MNTNTENKQTEINNSHTKTNNPNQQQRGAFDDLKDVFRISKNIEQEQEEKDDNIIVIQKSWSGLAFGYIKDTLIASLVLIIIACIFNILVLQNFFNMKIISIGIILILFICIIVERIINILTARIEINLEIKEAYISGIAGKTIIKEIVSIDLYKNYIFPFYNGIAIKGKGYNVSFGMAFIKDYRKVKKFVDKFYSIRN